MSQPITAAKPLDSEEVETVGSPTQFIEELDDTECIHVVEILSRIDPLDPKLTEEQRELVLTARGVHKAFIE